MDQYTQNYVDGFMADLIARNPGEKEFHQAVKEVLESVAGSTHITYIYITYKYTKKPFIAWI